jgi:Glycosyltransferase family 87
LAKRAKETQGLTTLGVDGRLVAGAVVLAYLGAVAVARLVFDFDLWRLFGVPTADRLFRDAQNVTSATECVRLGHDVLRDNPCDPLGRPLNYPRIWLIFVHVGMRQSWTLPFGLLTGMLFGAAVWSLFGRLTAGQGTVVALAVCSPAVMFGVERGQVDLLVFALMVVAVIAWRAGRASWAASPALVLAAAVAKLFPAFGLAAYPLARSRRAAVAAVAAGVVFVGYVGVTLDDVRAISQVVPQGQHFSYGARILVSSIARAIDAEAWEALGLVRQLVAAAPLAVAALGAWLAWQRSALLQALTPSVSTGRDDWKPLAFHLGALVFVGTFALANNWDYRLVFLLLCLPQLLAWSAEQRGPWRALGRLVTAGVLVQLWLGPFMGERTVIDEAWSWLLALVLTVLLVGAARAAWRNRQQLLSSGRAAVPQ